MALVRVSFVHNLNDRNLEVDLSEAQSRSESPRKIIRKHFGTDLRQEESKKLIANTLMSERFSLPPTWGLPETTAQHDDEN